MCDRDRTNSYVGMFSNTNVNYAMQYKEAFYTLYDSDRYVDEIALPMMYVLRHYLELILKYNIKYFDKFSDTNFLVGQLNSTHSLKKLSDGFKQHWQSVVSKYNIQINDAQYISDFVDLIKLIDDLDSFSMSFRYSHDRDNNRSFEAEETLNIEELKTLLEKVIPLLDNSTDVFYDKVGQSLEIEEEMQREYEREIERELMADMYSSYH